MQVKGISREDLILDHEKATEFLQFLYQNSFGLVPHDWKKNDTPSIHNLAVSLYGHIEREINTLEYLRINGFETH